MAREARKRSTQASRHSSGGRSSLPGWVWGLTGLSAGLLVALAVYLQRPAPHGTAAVDRLFQPQPSAKAGGQAAAQKPAPNDDPAYPRFEFYQLLPDQEVGGPAVESTIAPLATQHATAETSAGHPQPLETRIPHTQDAPGTNASYLLQAGSFRHLDDADRLKANLALLGIEASIQNVELAGGETWHRVRIGPFNDRQHLSKIRNRLQANKIHTLVLKHGG